MSVFNTDYSLGWQPITATLVMGLMTFFVPLNGIKKDLFFLLSLFFTSLALFSNNLLGFYVGLNCGLVFFVLKAIKDSFLMRFKRLVFIYTSFLFVLQVLFALHRVSGGSLYYDLSVLVFSLFLIFPFISITRKSQKNSLNFKEGEMIFIWLFTVINIFHMNLLEISFVKHYEFFTYFMLVFFLLINLLPNNIDLGPAGIFVYYFPISLFLNLLDGEDRIIMIYLSLFLVYPVFECLNGNKLLNNGKTFIYLLKALLFMSFILGAIILLKPIFKNESFILNCAFLISFILTLGNVQKGLKLKNFTMIDMKHD